MQHRGTVNGQLRGQLVRYGKADMKMIIRLCCLLLLLTVAAQAEIEKIAQVCDSGICFYWWPKLPRIKGWHQDTDRSYLYSINALAPDGFSFANAETVMYAAAIYKPRVPETNSLAMFIEDDKRHALNSVADIAITETDPLVTGDGESMRSFTFFPKSKGDWERVSYGEEGDYYLVFTLSSHSRAGFDKTQSTYRELIANYRARM